MQFLYANRIVAARLLIGIAQGLALYLLHEAGLKKSWPADQPDILRALSTAAGMTPFFMVLGIGNLRWPTFAIWSVVIGLVSAGLGFHAGHQEMDRLGWFSLGTILSTSIPVFLFIVNALVTGADSDRRPLATFRTYFEITWKHVTQYVLASLFVGLFWGMLWLAGTLFNAIHVDFVSTTISKSWFWIPVTCIVSSAALHLTDAQAGLVRGARSLLLNLLAWLLPVMVLIGGGFLVALFFTGLDPLWNTKRATLSLIIASGLLILLINAHFQDGMSQEERFPVLRYARFLAALMLVPLVVLAAVGLGLRIEQHGWTPPRVIGVACIVMLASHAIGYALAALRSGPALRYLPMTNIVSAFVTAAGLLALLTPLADPARISVDDQIARLESGRVDPEKFDLAFLERSSGRYGKDAYERLKTNPQGPNAARISARIEQLARAPKPGAVANSPASAETRAKNITVTKRAGSTLPAAFIEQDWKNAPGKPILPGCLTQAALKCDALMVDLADDSRAEIVIVDLTSVMVFAQDADGSWVAAGQIFQKLFCPNVRQALKAGDAQPLQPRFKDLEAAGERLQISSNACSRPRQ
ncbi:DUF4153 domain-containing protein [Reyranella sp.]|uniref:DUF4153 domain-containing protein n=1 Tax=Reyranella sp. TaxID=1929291 RepID=UPI003BAB6E29